MVSRLLHVINQQLNTGNDTGKSVMEPPLNASCGS